MPAAEVAVDADLVRRLLAASAPELASAAVRLVAEGWDNVVHRVGDDHCVRMPRRASAVELLENEWRWLRELAPLVSVATPLPLLRGEPGEGYPFPWLLCRWVTGSVVAALPMSERDSLATDLAGALTSLHAVVAPGDAPVNPWRGVPIAERDAVVRPRILAWDGDRDVLLRAWDEAVAAPVHPGPARWLHGDPHPFNLVQAGGRLSGILDFGDVTGGDPASDLATAWWTFGPEGRRAFRERVDAAGRHDPHVWTRARGWAASFASAMEPGSPLDAVAHHTAAQLALAD